MINDKQLSYLFKRNIVIYPVPIDHTWRPRCRIEINHKGNKQLGKQIYKQDNSLWKKIDELYEIIYNQIK